MIHWSQESFIQNPELVRLMFSLLHRQYDGLGELIRALPKAYAINAVSVQDTMDLLECLGQIRSLLIVQMGPEEERLMIQSIGSVWEDHIYITCIFFSVTVTQAKSVSLNSFCSCFQEHYE